MDIKQDDDDQLDIRDQRERARTRRLALAELRDLLRNDEGLRRLRAISDEDWAAAVAEDGEGAEA